MTNEDLFLAYSVSCHAGRFDNDPFSPDSIAEELVKLSPARRVRGDLQCARGLV